ncbi:DUF551 domain-containing protein [Klebsiella pneumoniae]|nr:DUF551 domain-containing protein [Klebsiella pneumoniae]
MTSKLTRERLEKIKSWRETYGAGSNVMLPAEEAEELACLALAAMDSEPVEMPLDYLQGHKDGLEWAARLAEANHPETGDWLYDDPIELAKAIRKGPDMPPAQPVEYSEPVAYIFKHPAGRLFWSLTDKSNKGHDDVMPVYASPQPAPIVEREPIAWLNDAYLARGVVDGEAGSEDAGPGYIPVYRHAQPAPVVPEEITSASAPEVFEIAAEAERLGLRGTYASYAVGWNACRAAMLQELKKSAGTEAICRSNENVQAVEVQSLTSINPAPDLVSLQKKAESIIGNYPGIPDCWCRTCRPVVLNDMRFVVCPDCGNKRCPRANDHRNACTGSNEPGQEGSAYPDTPREVKP